MGAAHLPWPTASLSEHCGVRSSVIEPFRLGRTEDTLKMMSHLSPPKYMALRNPVRAEEKQKIKNK